MLVKQLSKSFLSSSLMSIIGALMMLILLSQRAGAGELTVNINDIEQGKGHLMIAVYASSEAFNSNKPVKATKVKALNSKASVTFEQLPDGEYAIQMYQDENENGKFDMNMMGIPKEGYGFSNNVGRFGKPNYQKAKFVVQNNTVIDINLF